jgi:hypothetical protein
MKIVFKLRFMLNKSNFKSIKITIIFLSGVLLGIIADRNKMYLINAQIIRDYFHFRKKIPESNKILSNDSTMICFTIGQSNAADYGKGIYVPKNKQIYNYYKGDLFMANEPLLGADGPGSSVWTRVADMLIDSGYYKRVIIIPCAIGSTSAKCWAEGFCREKLIKTLEKLKEDNIKVTHIFWDQGETDNVDKTSKELYVTYLTNVINTFRVYKIGAPFYVSITSYVPFENMNPLGINEQITNAQKEVINTIKNVKEGPNTDSINLGYYRYQDLHFTENGLDVLAKKWFYKIIKN